MRLSKMKMFLLAAATGLHMQASAGLLDPSEYTIGDLSWLRLHETAGLSLNDFSAGTGGWSSQFRLATDSEIAGLFASIGLPAGYTDYHTVAPGAANFIFNVGGPFGTGSDYSNPIAAGRGLGWFAYARYTDGENGAPLSADCPMYTECGMSITLFARQDADARADDTGLFLVRLDADVPEPSTLALMGVAGALLAARRRKVRAA